MPDSIDVDIRMEKKEDEQDDAPFRCEVNVLVSDEGGRPLPGATIRIAGGSYDKEKPASDHGMSTTFKDVPLPATLTVTETGYKEVSLDLTEGDVNGDVTHGY
jgi:hypothetical protein